MDFVQHSSRYFKAEAEECLKLLLIKDNNPKYCYRIKHTNTKCKNSVAQIVAHLWCCKYSYPILPQTLPTSPNIPTKTQLSPWQKSGKGLCVKSSSLSLPLHSGSRLNKEGKNYVNISLHWAQTKIRLKHSWAWKNYVNISLHWTQTKIRLKLSWVRMSFKL